MLFTGKIQPSPLLKPSRYSIPSDRQIFKRYYTNSKLGVKMNLRQVVHGDDYAEVQIHNGQARVSNISHLIFPKGTPNSLIPVSRLQQLGITWNIEQP